MKGSCKWKYPIGTLSDQRELPVLESCADMSTGFSSSAPADSWNIIICIHLDSYSDFTHGETSWDTVWKTLGQNGFPPLCPHTLCIANFPFFKKNKREIPSFVVCRHFLAASICLGAAIRDWSRFRRLALPNYANVWLLAYILGVLP